MAIGLALAGVAQAQPVVYTWNSASGTAWETPADWTPATSTAGPGSNTITTNTDSAVFGATGTSTTIGIGFATTGTPLYLGTIQLASTNATFRTIGSSSSTAGTLVLNGDGANNLIVDNESVTAMTVAPTVSTGTGAMALQLFQPNSTINNILGTSSTNTGILTITAAIGQGASASGITKTGAGVLVLSGTNTFTGPTTISGGLIDYNTPGSLYNSTATNTLTTSNLVAKSGAALVLRIGTGGFTTADVDNLKSLGSATGGFLNGSGIGIDTSLGGLTYASNITDISYTGGSNSLGFYKLGPNTLTLTGTNTYSGGTFIRTGVIAVSGSQVGLPSGTNVTIGDPGLVTNTSALNIGTAAQTSPSSYTLGNVSAIGTGASALNIVNLAGSTTNTTTVNVNGTLTLSRGTFQGSGTGTILNINGPLVLLSATGGGSANSNATFNIAAVTNYTSATPISFSAQQTGSSSGFAGSRINLNATTLSLGTNINQDSNFTASATGTAQLTFQNSAKLRLTGNVPVLFTTSLSSALTNPVPIMGFGAGTGTPAVAGTIDTSGFSTTINTPITNIVTNTGGAISIIGGGAVTIAGNNSDNGGVILAAGTSLNINNSGVAAQSAIVASYSSGAFSLTVSPSAISNLVLGQSVSGTGITAGTFIRTINTTTNVITLSQTTGAGTNLAASATSSLGTGTFTNNGGTIDNTSGVPVTLATNNAQSWAGDFTFTGSNSLNMGTGAVTLTTNRIVTVSASNFTIGGAIGDNSNGFTLTKQGAGTLVLNGANAFGGALTVSAGTLAGTGSIAGPLTINSGATIAPGAGNTIGAFSVGTIGGNAVLANGGTYQFKYNPATASPMAGTDNSNLTSTLGTLDLSNLSASNTFNVNIGPATVGTPPGGSVTYTAGVFGSPILLPAGITSSNLSTLFNFTGAFGGTATASLDVTGQQLLFTFTPSSANTWTWGGATSGGWNLGGNWNPAVSPANNSDLVFGATSNPAMTNDVPGGLILHGMTFNAGSPTYTLGGNPLTFQANSAGTLPQIVINSSNSVTISAPVTLASNLTVSGTGNLTISSAISGAGSLTMNGLGTLTLGNSANSYSGGTVITNGTVQVAADSALGTGNVSGASLGTLSYSGSNSTTRSFNMNGGTLSVPAGRTLTFVGSQVVSTFLDGSGAFATDPTVGAVFASVTSEPSVTILSNSPLDQFVHMTHGGVLTVAANITGTATTFNGFVNQGSGTVSISANSKLNASNFQSYGELDMAPGSLASGGTGVTQLKNVGTSQMYFDSGSRTFIGTIPTASSFAAGIDLNGQNAVVADGLFVNNGYVIDNGAPGAVVIADYGSLVKGAGFFQNSPITRNGGRVQAGNSPGVASFGQLIFGPGGVSNYVFAIDNATGVAGPTADANGQVSGWGLINAVRRAVGTVTTSGDFVWTADPGNKLMVSLDTLVNPTTAGTDVPGLMANFDPTQSYSWLAAHWSGTYTGPTDAATLDAETGFDTSGFANPIAGTFGWSLDSAAQTLSLTYTPSAVPEPGTLLLVGAAAAGGWLVRKKRSKVS